MSRVTRNDPRGQRFRDGVITKRRIFQKYFSQGEIKAFVEQVLDEEPIAVAPGVLYVFRDKDAEQRFLVDRYRSRRTRLREPSARVRERPKRERRNRAEEQYLAHRDALERLWAQWLDLGRKPDRSESADGLALSEAFGSFAKALGFIEARKAAESDAESVTGTLEAAERARLAEAIGSFDNADRAAAFVTHGAQARAYRRRSLRCPAGAKPAAASVPE